MLRVLSFVGFAALAAVAQEFDRGVNVSIRQTPRASDHNADLRSDVNVVLVPVTVTNVLGHPVPGLEQARFHLFEDGVEHAIQYVNTEDAPVSAAIVFDASASMEQRMAEARQAVEHLLETSMPGDEFLLIQFNTKSSIVQPFTSDTNQIKQALPAIRAKGWTALLDAIQLAAANMKRAVNARKVLLFISDGADNRSRYNEAQIRNLIREGDASIYSIAIMGTGSEPNVELLTDLAEETGGRTIVVNSAADLPGAMERINKSLRSQYVLGYSPTNPTHDGKYRKIRLILDPPSHSAPLRASYRTGYYAPSR